MSNYDLSKFVEEQTKKKGIIKLGENHKYEIKANAWSFLRIQSIQDKYKGQDDEIGKKIVEIFLGKKALNFIEKNVDVAGKQQIIAIIVSHIFEVNFDKESKKK